MNSNHFLMAILLFGLAGCSPGPIAIPGCSCDIMQAGNTRVHYGTFQDEVAVMIWSDLANPKTGFSAGSGAGVSSNKAEFIGNIRADDGREVKWKAVTADGKSGTVTINEQNYLLEEGAVFLVRTIDGPIRIIQVRQDLSKMKPTAQTWELLGKQNPEIKKFLDESATRK